MKKVFLTLVAVLVAGSAAQAFPFWHHRHHRHHRYVRPIIDTRDSHLYGPGGVYFGN